MDYPTNCNICFHLPQSSLIYCRSIKGMWSKFLWYLILLPGTNIICTKKKKIKPWTIMSQLKYTQETSSIRCLCCKISTNSHEAYMKHDCWAYMLHHSVLEVFPPLLALFWIRKDICGRAVRWALSQLFPIILHQGGPAHQLHSGELFQKVPGNVRSRY